MRVLAVTNQKGGVGKTTSAVNIASCLAAAEQKTLLIDLDPQGNATSGLGFSKHDLTRSVYDVLVNRIPLKEVCLNTALSHLDLAPSNTQLVGAELELVSAFARETRLANAIQALGSEYQYVLIDCPPSLNLLTINALTASDGVLVPVQCEYYAMEGLTELVKTIQLVQDHLNPRLKIEGIVLTMYDARNNLARQVSTEVRGFFQEKVYETVIPRNVKLSESPSHGKSIILYDVHSKGAKSYLELTRELHLGKSKLIVQNNALNSSFVESGVPAYSA
jgi:ATPases involved in chromosome partitioning